MSPPAQMSNCYKKNGPFFFSVQSPFRLWKIDSMNCLKIATFVAFLAFFSPSVDACGSTQQKFDDWIRENQKEDEQGNPVKKAEPFPKKYKRQNIFQENPPTCEIWHDVDADCDKKLFFLGLSMPFFFYSFFKPNVCVKFRFAGN